MNSVNYGNIGDASGSQMETQQSNALPSSVQSKQQRNPVSVLSTQVSEVVIDDFYYIRIKQQHLHKLLEIISSQIHFCSHLTLKRS